MSAIGKSNGVYADGESIVGQLIDTEPYENSLAERALSNELVIDGILDHLPKEDWKSARLVNKTWLSTLQPRWRDQMMYKLGPGNKTFYTTVTSQFLEQQHPINNPNDPLQLSRHPIRNVSIRRPCDNNFIICFPDQIRFWELYGHGLKCIRLNEIQIPEVAIFKRLLFELTPNLEEFSYYKCICNDNDINKLELNTDEEYTPLATLQNNLKVSTLYTTNSFSSGSVSHGRNEFDYAPRFPIGWIEFLSVFPNLTKLSLDIDPPRDLLKFFEAIDIVRRANDNQVLNITELEIDSSDGGGFAHIDEIKIQPLFATLPISTLDLDITNISHDKLIALVQALKSTLRHLSLLLLGSDQDQDVYLPKDMLPSGLTKLYLYGSIFSSLEFLSRTPNLEELHLANITYMLEPEVCGNLDAVTPLVNLKRLQYTVDYVPVEKMDILAKLMPNVKRCECTVDANGFRALCRGWIKLEHLEVCLDFESEDLFVENLIQFKCLRSLEINYSEFDLSDKTVFEGFIRMPTLTEIQLASNV